MTALLHHRWRRGLVLLMAALLLSGCSRAPSIDIMGSFFPSWLVCLVMGIVLTTVVRLVLLRLQLKLFLPILAYTSMAAFFTFALWLIVFY